MGLNRRRVRYGARPCKLCGWQVTTNALGRAAHRNSKACIERQWRKDNPAFSYRMNQIACFIVSAIINEKKP